MIERLGLGPQSKVVEVASNDGYLLQHFLHAGIRVLGIEPAANVAAAAEAKGVPTIVQFFGRDTAQELSEEHLADLLVANNVLAHVPDVNDFVAGISALLKPAGVATLEFPHLLRLIEDVQFDTIYHEHFSYFSLSAAKRVFEAHGLTLFDVDELPTHGGSLRIYAGRVPGAEAHVSDAMQRLLEREDAAGLNIIETYDAFADRVKEAKRRIVAFFLEAKDRGDSIVGYGAPAKATTLLNYCGIGTDFIDYTVDMNPHKQGHYLPGVRIPIKDPGEIERTQPDLLFVFPWNIKDEVMAQMAAIRGWGGRFVVPSPRLEIYP